VKLGGTGYTFWGGREGYETLLNTDMKFEQENIAALMRMAVDYGRSIGFTGTFYIEPKPKEPMKHQYDFDAATAIAFLRQYGLDKDFMLNIEANHATLAGHTFQHDLRVAAINGMLGSVDANQGDNLLGWDTDQFPNDVYETTLAMYEILKSGGLKGGLNFDAKNRRPSYTPEDMLEGFILGMDAFALGLIKAAAIIEDGRIDQFVKERYASYDSELGQKIRKGKATLEELAQRAVKAGQAPLPGSGRQEYLEGVVNSVLFSGE
jgi:xylose isomerase